MGYMFLTSWMATPYDIWVWNGPAHFVLEMIMYERETRVVDKSLIRYDSQSNNAAKCTPDYIKHSILTSFRVIIRIEWKAQCIGAK